MRISPEAERILLEELGQEPEPDDEGHQHNYSEQDIWEQARKIINAHPQQIKLFWEE